MSTEDIIFPLIKNIARANCESSFRRFFHHFYPQMFELALYYTKNQALAEEVVSDVFLKVWKQRKRLETISNVKSYLLVAVKRQSLNYMRTTRYTPLFAHDLEQLTIIDGRTPENILLSDEMLEVVSQSIQNLPEKCRLVFKLVKEEKLKYKEVAELLNISEKTVDMHIGKALKRIREDLEQHTNEPYPLRTLVKAIFPALLILLSSF